MSIEVCAFQKLYPPKTNFWLRPWLNQRHQGQHVADLMTELFAHYLHIKHVRQKVISCYEFKRYALYISETRQFDRSKLIMA